jgi:hypothetical protein
MMMLDGCAGLGEHGRKKTNRNEQPDEDLQGWLWAVGVGNKYQWYLLVLL